MKILFTLDTLMGGGTETSTLELINQFDKTVEVTVCYFYNKHDLADLFRSANCKLIYLDLKGSYSLGNGFRKLYKLVKQEKYDLIVTSLYRASMISRFVSLISGVPLVDTMVNDSYGIEKRNEFKGWHIIKFRLVYLLDRITAFIPTLWISNSKFLALQLGKQLSIPPSKINVIYRGRDIKRIKKWEPPVNNSEFRFVSIGRLFAQKAQDDLINAFSLFNQQYPHSMLTIYGEGPQRAYLEELIKNLNLSERVSLPGRVNNAWEELYNSNCFILPSKYEGFSGALVEAVISGIPIIASNIPMNIEAIQEGVTGFIHPVRDITALSIKMKEVFENYEAAIEKGRFARKVGIIKYDLNKISVQYLSLLKSEIAIQK